MRVGWDLTDLAPNKDGTFELLSRWLECVAAYPAGHAHICFANAGFRRLANHPVLDRLDWRICGNWPNRLQLRREGYFWRCGESLRREVDVLISVYRPPFAWRGKSITIVLDCTKELFPTVRGFKNHVMARLRDIGARRSGRWLAISEWTRRDVVRLRGYPADRVRSAGIPLADLEALPSAAAPAAIPQELAERRYAFYCSAISGRKNHERLIRAWRRAFPNREVLLVLAGRELPGIPAGIGETIRVSLTPQPGEARTQEVVVAAEILQSLGLRAFVPSVTACPGCGRTTSTTFQELAKRIDDYLRAQMPTWRTRYPGVESMKVAVMGCIVNGPGESKHADIGISLPGTGEAPVAPVYIDGVKTHTLRGENIVQDFQALVEHYVQQRYGSLSKT